MILLPTLLGLFAILGFLVGMVRPLTFGGGRWRVLFGSIGLFVIASIWADSMIDTDKERQIDTLVGQPTEATSRPAQTTAAPAPLRPAAPDAQRRLAAIVDDYAARYDQAPNDMARGALRPQRAAAICQATPNRAAQGWVGLIENLSSTNDGKGVLEIRVSRRLVVKTWNNNLSDTTARTLIASGSPLHQRLSAMRVGQVVVFDGTFISDAADCLLEGSLSVRGAMLDPDFLLRFTDVRPAPE